MEYSSYTPVVDIRFNVSHMIRADPVLKQAPPANS